MTWVKCASASWLACAFSAAAQHPAHAPPPQEPQAKPVSRPQAPAREPAKPLYRSAFADYRPFRDDEPRDWRQANETVRAAGGHAGLMKPHGHGK